MRGRRHGVLRNPMHSRRPDGPFWPHKPSRDIGVEGAVPGSRPRHRTDLRVSGPTRRGWRSRKCLSAAHRLGRPHSKRPTPGVSLRVFSSNRERTGPDFCESAATASESGRLRTEIAVKPAAMNPAAAAWSESDATPTWAPTPTGERRPSGAVMGIPGGGGAVAAGGSVGGGIAVGGDWTSSVASGNDWVTGATAVAGMYVADV